MGHRHRILKFLFHYGIIQFIIFAFVLYGSFPYVYKLLEPLWGSLFDTYNRFHNITMQSRLLMLFYVIIWLIAYYVVLRDVRYCDYTGRSYIIDHDKYHRSFGSLVEYFKDAEPQRMDKDELPDITWHESKGIILGKKDKKLISFEPDKNGAVIFAWGAPGVGKTTCIIIPSARQWGLTTVWSKKDRKYKIKQKGAVMLLDLKGDIYNANKDYRRIKRFSTIDVDNSYHYDPLITARTMNEDELSEFLDNLAITLIPEERGAESAYFTKCARGLFTAIFTYCLHEDINKSFSDICLDITIHSHDYWTGDDGIITHSNYIPAMKYSTRFDRENQKNVGGGYSKLCDCLMIYTSATMKKLLINDGNCISPEDLEKCTDVYIQIDPNSMDIYAPLVAMLFQVFMSAALYRKEGQNPPLAYIIDEFGQLPMMPVIQKSAMLMRAYNATILISTQSLASIDQHYGEEGRKLLMDCAKAHCFLSINDPDTRDWASRLIGTRKVLKLSNSLNHNENQTSSESVTETKENVFEPEAFSLLPDDHSVIIWKSGHYIKGETCYYND